MTSVRHDAIGVCGVSQDMAGQGPSQCRTRGSPMPSDGVGMLNEQLRSNPFDPDATIEELRALIPDTVADPGTTVTPVDAGPCTGRWVVADGADPDRRNAVSLRRRRWFGSEATHRNLTSRLSHAAGIAVMSLGYRLAPEHRCRPPAARDRGCASCMGPLCEGGGPVW